MSVCPVEQHDGRQPPTPVTAYPDFQMPGPQSPNDAFQAGYDAYGRGVPSRNNPYKPRAQQYAVWKKGQAERHVQVIGE